MNTMQSDNELTQELLKEYLSYDPNTGHLTWIKKPSKKTVLNTRAGALNKAGYRTLQLAGKNVAEHRAIWCMVYGQYPKGVIDHINQIRDDNRISNLREVTHAENCRNRTRAKNTRLDEVGIWWCRRRKRYIAEITFNGKKVYQKSFKDIDMAIKQRKAKALELGFHDNHGNK